MTTFTYAEIPFNVKASVGATGNAFQVSTNGQVSATDLAATDLIVTTTMAAGFVKIIASISATVSVPVTAAGFFTITDATGTVWRVPAYTTLA